jgi:hypothetical protein
VGDAHLGHSNAGVVEVFTLSCAGGKPWTSISGGYVGPALIDNVIGGVSSSPR